MPQCGTQLLVSLINPDLALVGWTPLKASAYAPLNQRARRSFPHFILV